MYKKIEKCRICGNTHLECVLDLGEQMLTGVFPREKDAEVTTGPLRLIKCLGGDDVCGLLQMEHSYDLGELYGENYGYQSGLNASMVSHLNNKVMRILDLVELCKGDLVIDIGSNDGTTLQAYPSSGLVLVGVDPIGSKFNHCYPPHIQFIPDFFSSALIKERFPEQKAKVVTSFSMFYDLEDPMGFMRQVHEVLADDGVWILEQSYMPAIQKVLDEELAKNLNTLKPYQEFAKRVDEIRCDFLEFIKAAQAQGKTIAALGASTKGNVLLQYCGISAKEVEFVGEVNPDKCGCHTPGTWIPIIPEQELLSKKPDYLIVLPWHFRKFFIENKKFSGMSLVFPLPKFEVVKIE